MRSRIAQAWIATTVMALAIVEGWGAVSPVQGTSGLSSHSMAVFGNTVYVGTQGKGIYTFSADGTGYKPTPASLATESTNAFAFEGSRVLAAGYGIYATSDQGANWSLLPGLKNQWIHALIYDGGKLFAGTDEGLQISGDAGVTWSRPTGISQSKVKSLAVSGLNIFVALGGGLFSSSTLFRSQDGGLTWKAIPYQSGDNEEAEDLVILGTNLLLASDDSIHFSPDLGNTWSKSPGQKIVFEKDGFICDMVSSDGLLAVARSGSFGGDYLFLSGDGGLTWSEIPEAPESILAMAINRDNIYMATVGIPPGAFWTSHGRLAILPRTRRNRREPKLSLTADAAFFLMRPGHNGIVDLSGRRLPLTR